MRIRVLPLLAVVLLAAACSSSPATAQSLAKKIPGCNPRSFSTGLSPYAVTEVTCDTPDGSVWLATFSCKHSPGAVMA